MSSSLTLLSHSNLNFTGSAAQSSSYVPGVNRGLTSLPLSHSYGLLVTIAGLHSPERAVGVLMRWFDPTAFLLPLQGTFGNTPRDFLRGPGFANVDLSIVKNLALVADRRIQFRIEVFNLFDRANFAVPNRSVFAGATQNDPVLPTAGQITRTTNTSRQLQLSAKIIF